MFARKHLYQKRFIVHANTKLGNASRTIICLASRLHHRSIIDPTLSLEKLRTHIDLTSSREIDTHNYARLTARWVNLNANL